MNTNIKRFHLNKWGKLLFETKEITVAEGEIFVEKHITIQTQFLLMIGNNLIDLLLFNTQTKELYFYFDD